MSNRRIAVKLVVAAALCASIRELREGAHELGDFAAGLGEATQAARGTQIGQTGRELSVKGTGLPWDGDRDAIEDVIASVMKMAGSTNHAVNRTARRVRIAPHADDFGVGRCE